MLEANQKHPTTEPYRGIPETIGSLSQLFQLVIVLNFCSIKEIRSAYISTHWVVLIEYLLLSSNKQIGILIIWLIIILNKFYE